MKTRIHHIILHCLFIALLAGCKTVTKNEPSLSLVFLRNTEGKESFVLSGFFPEKTHIEGTFKKEVGGKTVLFIESFHWFNNWNDGWTETRFLASGTLIKEESATGSRLAIEEPLLLEDPEKATIRYRDTILESDVALKQFGNRWERIRSAVNFLNEKLDLSEMPYNEFKAKSETILFPEVYGYSDKRTQKNNTVRAEGIEWDTIYSDEIIPEELWEVRNTGTLFRDWEETSKLFYFWYIREETAGRLEGYVTITEKN